MNNGEYWQKRFELLEQAAHQQGVQCYADIEKQYRQAQKQLEGQIAAWYQRFASNNGVTLAEAKRMLNAKELAELKWDVNQYIQYGQENAINGTWVKQLENACADVAERMYDCLEYITTDGDTKPIRGSKMNHQVVDGVLNFFVNYDFFTVKTEDQTPMETMTASTDMKEGG